MYVLLIYIMYLLLKYVFLYSPDIYSVCSPDIHMLIKSEEKLENHSLVTSHYIPLNYTCKQSRGLTSGLLS